MNKPFIQVTQRFVYLNILTEFIEPLHTHIQPEVLDWKVCTYMCMCTLVAVWISSCASVHVLPYFLFREHTVSVFTMATDSALWLPGWDTLKEEKIECKIMDTSCSQWLPTWLEEAGSGKEVTTSVFSNLWKWQQKEGGRVACADF